MNAVVEIVNAKYLATPDQVQALARAHCNASNDVSEGSRTYLGILVALVQKRAKRSSKAADDVVAVFENLAAQIYQDVIAGVSEPGIERSEISRRATFARTAASTLRSYLTAGLPLRDLDPATVSKAQLRKLVVPPEPVERSSRIMSRAMRSVRSVVDRLAKTDRARAMRELTTMINQLNEQLTDLETQVEEEQVEIVSHAIRRHEPEQRVMHSQSY